MRTGLSTPIAVSKEYAAFKSSGMTSALKTLNEVPIFRFLNHLNHIFITTKNCENRGPHVDQTPPFLEENNYTISFYCISQDEF